MSTFRASPEMLLRPTACTCPPGLAPVRENIDAGPWIAHEINQPLAAILLHAAGAMRWLRREPPDIERALSSLAMISTACRDAGDIVRSVQRLAALEASDMGMVAVDEVIADTLRLMQGRLRKQGIGVEPGFGLGGYAIRANRVQLQQVMTNLVVNAVEALERRAGGAAPKRIWVASRRRDDDDIEVTVIDNGPGIAPCDRGRVFGSPFSTKASRTGIGLAISLAIVHAHGGRIGYEPVEPHGACFRVHLPGTNCAPS